MDLPNTGERRKHHIRFPMPDLPRDVWCDFRIDLVEHGMTLVQLAEKYYCDPRTVRSCIQHNKSSFELGKKTTPTRIQVYEDQIRELLTEHLTDLPEQATTIYGLSQYLYPLLQKQGYTASERTLRNHLQKQPYVKALLEKQTLTEKHLQNEPASGSERSIL